MSKPNNPADPANNDQGAEVSTDQDQATAEMIEQMEKESKQREAALKEAQELGIQVGANQKTESILQQIESVKESKKQKAKKPAAQSKPAAPREAKAGDVVVNSTKWKRRINGIEITSGDSYKLTKKDVENDNLMAKVNHCLKLGVLSYGTD